MAITRFCTRASAQTTESKKPTFYPFHHLPVELQRMIWQKAAENCFVTYQTIRRFNVKTDGPLKHRRNKMRMIHHRELCNRRWVKLLCACRVSYEVAMNADREEREERRKSYWYRGRQWEETVRFYQENGPEENGDWSGVEIYEDFREARVLYTT